MLIRPRRAQPFKLRPFQIRRAAVNSSSQDGYYSTNFPLTENPMVDDGGWVLGNAFGDPWTVPRVDGGISYGTQTGAGNADDSVAFRASGFTNAHRVKVILSKTAGSFQFQEVEVWLRSTHTPGSLKGLEVNVASDGEYIQIWQWLGGYTTGQPTPFVKQIDGRTVASMGTSVADGSVLEAEISAAGLLRVWLNSILAFSVDYPAWATANGYEVLTGGQPGFGFYTHNQPQTNAFAAKSFEAWDI